MMPASHMADRVPAAPVPSQFPGNVSGKAAESNTSTWAPATHLENQDAVPGSRFQPGPALASVAPASKSMGQRLSSL